MGEKKYSKVVYNGTTLIDLTGDTIIASKMLKDYTAHDKAGVAIIGTCTFNNDTTDADVQVGEILSGKTAYARGAKLTGTMPNIGKQTSKITTVAQSVAISAGYHDGSGTVAIDDTEQGKIKASNILQGVTILGVTGTSEPSSAVTAQSKTVTPTGSQQVITPDTSYDYLSQVTVNAIPYAEADNTAGGITVTIGSAT